MLLLFEAPADAVGYALAYQEALRALVPPLEARVGLHVGPVTLRENSPPDVARGAKPLEVDGVAKSIAARVMSVASGGQILLSARCPAAIGDGGVRLQSHGHWRLKGVAEPIELFEAGDDHAPFAPPPDADKAYRVVRQGDALAAGARDPAQPARRARRVRRPRGGCSPTWRAAFEAGARLVSVLGMGGTGKTRLVTRFGWSWLGRLSRRRLVLRPRRRRAALDGIVHAVAQGLDVPLGQGRSGGAARPRHRRARAAAS